jgi:hypothetical protein
MSEPEQIPNPTHILANPALSNYFRHRVTSRSDLTLCQLMCVYCVMRVRSGHYPFERV